MAVSSREELKQYCLRDLGAPVIRIPVSDEQLEDRIDEALSYFKEYHYDGVERVYLKHEVTQLDIDNKYLPLSSLVTGVTRVLPISKSTYSNGLFGSRFQLVASDLVNLSSFDLINYELVMQHVQLIDDVLFGHTQYRFNKFQDKLFIDIDWKSLVAVGDFIVVECHRALNPDEYTKMWDDRFLKLYTAALFKRQWGANSKKFSGVQLPGGVTISGQDLYDEAIKEIEELENDMLNKSTVLNIFQG